MLTVEQWCQSPTGTNWLKWAVDTYEYVPAHIERGRKLVPIPVFKRRAA